MCTPQFIVRSIRTDEGELLRAIRLAALADAPSAFCATYADEERFSLDEWNDRAKRGAEGLESVTFFAFHGDRAVGLVTAFPAKESDSRAELVSMWVAPEARGHGVAARLVEAVLTWAKIRDIPTVQLCVNAGNDRAEHFYRKLGFVEESGHSSPTSSCITNRRMCIAVC